MIDLFKTEYSQGVCEDGAAILKNGKQLTIEKILSELRVLGEVKRKLKNKIINLERSILKSKAAHGRFEPFDDNKMLEGFRLANLENELSFYRQFLNIIEKAESKHE